MNNYIFGRKVVLNTISKFPRQISKLFIERDIKLSPEDKEIINSNNIGVTLWTKRQIEDEFGYDINHQGFVAVVKEYNYVPFAELMNSEPKKILILDRIQDPHNFGAIIRSSAQFGVDGIVILNHNQVEVTPTVVKTSAGAIYNLKISRVSNLSNAIKVLKDKGFWIYCSALKQNAVDLNKVDFSEKLAVIIGNEGEGVTDKLIANSDVIFKINTDNAIDSLNASVAAGIILFKTFSR